MRRPRHHLIGESVLQPRLFQMTHRHGPILWLNHQRLDDVDGAAHVRQLGHAFVIGQFARPSAAFHIGVKGRTPHRAKINIVFANGKVAFGVPRP